MSQAVQDRLKRCLTVVVAGYAYATVVAEATRRWMRDFLRRQREQGGSDEKRQPAPSIEELFRLSAEELEERCRGMVEADVALKRIRSDLRRWRRRRARRALSVYDYLAMIRKLFRGLVAYEGAIDHLGLRGPTPRKPSVLLRSARNAVEVLADPEKEPVCSIGTRDDRRLRTTGMARRLKARCDRLAEALTAVSAAAAAEAAAREAQRQAIEDVGRWCLKTARFFELQLEVVGLPTLASAVRPGVKRRGRPAKARPVDVFPDLVDQGIAMLSAIDGSQVLARMVGEENAALLEAVEAAVGLGRGPSRAEDGPAGPDGGRGLKAAPEKS